MPVCKLRIYDYTPGRTLEFEVLLLENGWNIVDHPDHYPFIRLFNIEDSTGYCPMILVLVSAFVALYLVVLCLPG